jgi:hypothetical protein
VDPPDTLLVTVASAESVLEVEVGAGCSGAGALGPESVDDGCGAGALGAGSLDVGSGAGALGAGSEEAVGAVGVVSVADVVACVVPEAAVVACVTGSVAAAVGAVVVAVTVAAGSEVVVSVADPAEAAMPLMSLMVLPPKLRARPPDDIRVPEPHARPKSAGDPVFFRCYLGEMWEAQ